MKHMKNFLSSKRLDGLKLFRRITKKAGKHDRRNLDQLTKQQVCFSFVLNILVKHLRNFLFCRLTRKYLQVWGIILQVPIYWKLILFVFSLTLYNGIMHRQHDHQRLLILYRYRIEHYHNTCSSKNSLVTKATKDFAAESRYFWS